MSGCPSRQPQPAEQHLKDAAVCSMLCGVADVRKFRTGTAYLEVGLEGLPGVCGWAEHTPDCWDQHTLVSKHLEGCLHSAA
jgi:hypothetical protein